jgi:hypothetical protein
MRCMVLYRYFQMIIPEQHLSVARYLFYMRCMVHYVNPHDDFPAQHLSVARYLFYMRCMVHYVNYIIIVYFSE